MDILRKNYAPVSEQAWEEINEEAKNIFNSALSARKFVDVDGPKGFDTASVSIGKLDVPGGQKKSDVQYGIHKVLPLIEVRMPFSLNIWELDNVERGNEDIDLDNLAKAAHKVVDFEEEAIYKGFNKANIEGLLKTCENPKMKLGNIDDLVKNLTSAIIELNKNGIDGGFDLIAGKDLYTKIMAQSKGYPLKKHVEETIDGKIILADKIDGAVLVPNRGGDFRLTLGQDLSIGYEAHDQKNVHLYFTESFTFQVIDPASFIIFE